jgi:hypothetical protein
MTKAYRSAISHSGSITKQLGRGLPFAVAAALLAASGCTIKSADSCGAGGNDDITPAKGGKTGSGGATAADGGTTVVGNGGTTVVGSGGTTTVTAAAGATTVATGGVTVVAAAGSTAVAAAGSPATSAGGTTGVAGAAFAVTAITAAEACANSTQPLGLSMYILQDATGSMTTTTSSGESKWDAVTAAVSAFVVDADSVKLSAGLGFFSVADPTTGDTCALANYTTPVVPVASLGTNGTTIANALTTQGQDLTGMTATPIALQGAVTYARTVATQRAATDRVIIVLATDGMPNDCYTSNAVTETSDAAAAGLAGTPSIPTYVLGVVAASDTTSLDNLNAFALAGGTGTAFVVDTAGTGNRSTRALFGNAMSQIRDANLLACTVAIPPATAGKVINSARASLEYTVGSTTTAIAWRSSYTSCDASTGGYYYDNNEAPTNVTLCPASCNTLQSGASASLAMHFGCKAGTSTGAGGASGTGGAPNRGPVCLLSGQSCSSSATCCSLVCSGGICG